MHNSGGCITTFSNSNWKLWFSVWPYHFLTQLWRNFGLYYYSASRYWGLYLLICCALNFKNWTLTGRQNHDSAVLCNLGQALAVGEVASHLMLEYFCIKKSSRSTLWLQGAQVLCLKNRPQIITPPPPRLTVLRCFEVFVVICCVCFLPNMVLFITAKHLQFHPLSNYTVTHLTCEVTCVASEIILHTLLLHFA